MQLQYLGNSRDAFKWEYLDFLAKELEVPVLKVVPMLTPDGDSRKGSTPPSLFPSLEGIQKFCCHLQKNRRLKEIRKLPKYTNAKDKYKVKLYKENEIFFGGSEKRERYFSDIISDIKHAAKEIVFLDPGIGFCFSESASREHVTYSDIWTILDKVDESAVIVAYQYRWPFTKFEVHYGKIAGKLEEYACDKTALLGGGASILVAISKSEERIDRVRCINEHYKKQLCPRRRPVKLIS